MKSPSCVKQNQQGAVLLAMMAVIMILVTSAFLASLSLNKQRITQNKNNAKVLSDAKQALIANALVQSPPGKLICPDFDGDGVADYAGSNCRTQRGFVPYRDLSLKHYHDAFNNILWYAVDAAYIKTNGANLNPNLGGQLRIDSAGSYVALLIAPGAVLVNQQRGNSDNANRVAQYLEGENADGNSARYSKTKDDIHNDDVMAISTEEFWPVVEKRVLHETALLLTSYYNTAGCAEYPWAATSPSSGDSVMSNEWGYVPMGVAIPYAGASACPGTLNSPAWLKTHWSDVLRYAFCGPSGAACITMAGDKSGSYDALLVSAGPELEGQSRTSANINDYLEAGNADLDMHFEFRDERNFDDGFNDVVYPITP
ncbi:hypothetical protein TDB9533_03960 [Thalassocella blandensis]|nr:hypothetical protein TDB9533_03960 [Thalassocella blandensis]